MIDVKLDEILEKQGKSRYWLADVTGIAASSLSNLANNKTGGIKFDLLVKICKALNCEPGDILKIGQK